MTIIDAINEVLENSSRPRNLPSGARSIGGEELMELVEKNIIDLEKEPKAPLTEAQQQVASLVWRLCAHILIDPQKESFASEQGFVDGFRAEHNRDHEIALWLDFSFCFKRFMNRYPSENPKAVLKSFNQLTLNLPPEGLPGKRARELAKIWAQYRNQGKEKADWEWLLEQ